MDDAVDEEEYRKEVESLTPCLLDHSKCTSTKSFVKLLKNAEVKQEIEKRQKKQFQLGNGEGFSDPMEAAEYLLEREYGDTHLFDKTASVIIPSVFVSRFHEQNKNGILNYDINEDIKRTYDNCKITKPDYWFTKELAKLNAKTFSKTDYDEWVLRIKILYIIHEKIPGEDIPMIDQYQKFEVFYKECVEYLEATDPLGSLTVSFQDLCTSDGGKKTKKLVRYVKEQLEKITTNPITEWLINIPLSDISGEEPERWLFEQIKSAIFGNNDYVFLHSCDFLLNEENRHQEFDCLLFSLKRKLIIAIEAKSTFPRSNWKKPFKQLKNYKSVFEERLGDQLCTWKFLPVLFVYKGGLPYPYPTDCIITKKTNIKDWLKCIDNKENDNIETLSNTKVLAKDQLKNVLKIIVFCRHFPKSSLPGPLTTTKVTNYIAQAIEAVSTCKNIIFYSKNQLPLFMNEDDSTCKKVIITGEYGSGKTFLLKEKAEILSQEGEKVLFIIGKSHTNKSLLHLTLEDQWKEKDNIIIVNRKDILGKRHSFAGIKPKDVLKYVKKRDIEHVFIDEWDVKSAFDKNKEKDIGEFNELTEAIKGYFWIVWSYDTFSKIKSPVQDLGSFKQSILTYSMRNTKPIIEIARTSLQEEEFPDVSVQMPPYNFPEGLKPDIIISDNKDDEFNINNAIDKALRQDMGNIGILFLICFPSHITKQEEKTKKIIQIVEDRVNKTRNVISYFSTKCLHELSSPKSDPDKLLEYLQRENNSVLVTDMEAAEGFEWPLVINYRYQKTADGYDPSYSSCNSYMRAISTLSIIKNNN